MKLWRALTEKSWLDQSLPTVEVGTLAERDFTSKRIALCVFLVIVTVVFSLFVVTFLTHSLYPGFQALAGEPWRPLGDTSQLWVNTGLLVLSSALMQLSVNSARAGKPGYCLASLLSAALFTLLFLLAQLWLWQQLSGMGYGVRSNPSSSYFFLFTGVHGIHLLGGLLVLARPLSHIWHASKAEVISKSLRLCAVYWHYLLAVWLILFFLLTRSPETYRFLAVLCGLEA
ncbi:cytochrome c oxidase subunit 3 [Marinimicrobium sp. C2-29]|uniref:cytochrome c oxidase subunit 3 n=1 Tax=Marinimicrobium sp. C2-29 TaxID=3139825 RepID=UPI00313887A9